mgnify:FL=1|jgi:hypothetical protein
MTTTINKDNDMRDDINRAVDTGMLRNKQLTEWRKVLYAILEEYNAMSDGYIITIQGERAASNEPQFVNQMRLTLGQLRGMK